MTTASIATATAWIQPKAGCCPAPIVMGLVAGWGMTMMGMTMKKSEWIRRYVASYRQLSGTESVLDGPAAETAADKQAELHGSSGIAWEPPEDVAERDFDELESSDERH